MFDFRIVEIDGKNSRRRIKYISKRNLIDVHSIKVFQHLEQAPSHS